MEESGSIQVFADPNPEGQNRSDPKVPDLEHCRKKSDEVHHLDVLK
jgi:hypothetical protein